MIVVHFLIWIVFNQIYLGPNELSQNEAVGIVHSIGATNSGQGQLLLTLKRFNNCKDLRIEYKNEGYMLEMHF